MPSGRERPISIHGQESTHEEIPGRRTCGAVGSSRSRGDPGRSPMPISSESLVSHDRQLEIGTQSRANPNVFDLKLATGAGQVRAMTPHLPGRSWGIVSI